MPNYKLKDFHLSLFQTNMVVWHVRVARLKVAVNMANPNFSQNLNFWGQFVHWPIKCKRHKGRAKGPLVAPVCICFRKNVIVTCKIGSFLCSLANFFRKMELVFFSFWNQISKWRSLEKKKRSYFWPTFHIF